MASGRSLTVGERIVIHLSQYSRHSDAYVCPPGMAQAGIARTLRISRAHTAIELKRQMEAGRILTRMAHVKGMPTRRKVYHLTPKGLGVANGVRARARSALVEIVFPNGFRERLDGGRAIDLLRREGLPESRAIHLVLTEEMIDLGGLDDGAGAQEAPLVSRERRAQIAFERTFRQPYAWHAKVVQGPPNVPPVDVAA